MSPVHDQSYRRYQGSRLPPGQAWLVIARAGLRQLIRRRPFLVRKHSPFEDGTAQRTDADLVESAERRAAVKKAILELPQTYREVIVLRHFASLSYEEIGEAIGIPLKTVKSRLYSARHLLAGRLGAWV